MHLPSLPLLLLSLLGCSTPTPAAPAAPRAQQSAPPAVSLKSGEHAYRSEFFSGARYSAEVTAPDAVLGVPAGERPARHQEVLRLWRAWADESPRVRLEIYGRTHEGRELLRGIVSSPRNIARLEALSANLRRLHDPRGLGREDEERLLADTPAVAWIGCSIHGDEMSGVDGGLALAHHLIADTGDEVRALLEQVVVVLDPMMNPDGRERFLSMLEASAGQVPNLDISSLQRGRWPYGRGNHYLFDMNRDWLTGIAPETRARWQAVLALPPQLFVDAHEMGGNDTFLFYPQAKPFNPHLPASLARWQRIFGAASAQAFDSHGWSYYTREWADAWGPFYSDAWGSLNGAVGMLYEQARYGGQPLRRESGEVVTHREGAHRQAIAAWSHVRALADNRAELMADWVAGRRAVGEGEGAAQALVVRAGVHPTREAWLLSTLIAQGVEVRRASEPLRLESALDRFGARASVELPAGAWIISARQPQGGIVRAALEFDTRLDEAALLEERKELEQKDGSRIYDVTAWSLPVALDLECWWVAEPAGASAPVGSAEMPAGGVEAASDARAPIYGWVVDGRDDGAVVFAAQALEAGLRLQLADEPFEAGGAAFARGSLLVRRHENDDEAPALVERCARAARVRAHAVTSARAPGEGHDLGGQHFRLLARPRVALLSNSPFSADSFGHTWHLIDQVLGLPASQLDVQALGRYDLRRYNVIVLPPAGGLRRLLEPIAADLATWVRSGGTLIAMEGSAEALCGEKLGLSGVRLRQDVLEELDAYAEQARREAAAREVRVDPELVYGSGEAPAAAPEAAKEKQADKAPAGDAKTRERLDAWQRRFKPVGAFLRGVVDTTHWITAGAGAELPVHFDGDQVLLCKAPTRAAVRLADGPRLRVSGLLWPEARERLSGSAWLTVESLGHGQIVLFASQPGFRGFHMGSARLLANAIVYGPGAGANQPAGW